MIHSTKKIQKIRIIYRIAIVLCAMVGILYVYTNAKAKGIEWEKSQKEHFLAMNQGTTEGSNGVHPYRAMMDITMIGMHKADMEDKRCIYTNFLSGMIPHHEGAVIMAKYELENGSNPKMLMLAKNILADQEKEIEEMKALLREYKACPKNEKITQKYTKAMAGTMHSMMQGFPKGIDTEENADRAFAMAMIPHHQSAIDMAKVVMQYSKNKEVLSLAKNIINSQEKEIAVMKAFLKETQ